MKFRNLILSYFTLYHISCVFQTEFDPIKSDFIGWWAWSMESPGISNKAISFYEDGISQIRNEMEYLRVDSLGDSVFKFTIEYVNYYKWNYRNKELDLDSGLGMVVVREWKKYKSIINGKIFLDSTIVSGNIKMKCVLKIKTQSDETDTLIISDSIKYYRQ